jgi:hypothetical protein
MYTICTMITHTQLSATIQSLCIIILATSILISCSQQTHQTISTQSEVTPEIHQPTLEIQPICTLDQFSCPYGFSLEKNATHCSCVNTTIVKYQTLAECEKQTFICPKGYLAYFSQTSCGCRPAQAIRCNQTYLSCTSQYNPVCAYGSKLRCINEPCAITFDTICSACQTPDIDYVIEGQCQISPQKKELIYCRDQPQWQQKTLQMCDAIYNPVCAHKTDATTFVASNPCLACSTTDVDYYYLGEC